MKFNYEIEDGVFFECDFCGNVDEYALMWLNLTNNARVNSKVFLDFRNFDDNRVHIVAAKEHENEVNDYLIRIGLKVEGKNDIKLAAPYAIYEKEDDYDYHILPVSEF